MQQYMNKNLYTLIAPCSAFGLESCDKFGVANPHLSLSGTPAMAFIKKEKSRSFMSRTWSTKELEEGLQHLLTDGRLELPDDLAQLKDPGVMVAERWGDAGIVYLFDLEEHKYQVLYPNNTRLKYKFNKVPNYRAGSMALQVYVLPYIV